MTEKPKNMKPPVQGPRLGLLLYYFKPVCLCTTVELALNKHHCTGQFCLIQLLFVIPMDAKPHMYYTLKGKTYCSK